MNGEFFVSCGDTSVFFHPSNTAFHDVAPAIRAFVKRRVPRLVPFRRNHRYDTAFLEPHANRLGCISLVTCQFYRPLLWTPTGRCNPDGVNDPKTNGSFMGLAGADVNNNRQPPAVRYKMDFCAESSSAAAQCVVGGLVFKVFFFQLRRLPCGHGLRFRQYRKISNLSFCFHVAVPADCQELFPTNRFGSNGGISRRRSSKGQSFPANPSKGNHCAISTTFR